MNNTFYNTQKNVYNCLKNKGVVNVGVDNISALNDVYKELVELIGYDNTMILYTHFKGQQITFPVKLYNPESICEMVKSQYDGKNAKQLSRTYGYSERWIKELIKKGI